MTEISTFSHAGQDIDVLMDNGKLSYVFERKGKRFGNAVKIEGKKDIDLVRATMALVLNYLETKEAAEKLDEPKDPTKVEVPVIYVTDDDKYFLSVQIMWRGKTINSKIPKENGTARIFKDISDTLKDIGNT